MDEAEEDFESWLPDLTGVPLPQLMAMPDEPWLRAATERVVRGVLDENRVWDCGPITRSSDD